MDNQEHSLHLYVLVHGFAGNPSQLNVWREALEERQSNTVVLVANSNRGSLTCDGIDVCGERLADEIFKETSSRAQRGGKITHISVVGYSLGGLIARYAIGVLQRCNFFDTIVPIGFTTLATPHLGARRLGFASPAWNSILARVLSASGRQLFLEDGAKDATQPLLLTMATAKTEFVQGLKLFHTKVVYANVVNDRVVPYYSASVGGLHPFLASKDDTADLQAPWLLTEHDRPLPTRLTFMVYRTTLSQATDSLLLVLSIMVPAVSLVLLTYAGYQSYRSTQRVNQHKAQFKRASITTNSGKNVATLAINQVSYDSVRLSPQQCCMALGLGEVEFERVAVYDPTCTNTHKLIVARRNRKDGMGVLKHWTGRFLPTT